MVQPARVHRAVPLPTVVSLVVGQNKTQSVMWDKTHNTVSNVGQNTVSNGSASQRVHRAGVPLPAVVSLVVGQNVQSIIVH